jgi:hypothetical protein
MDSGFQTAVYPTLRALVYAMSALCGLVAGLKVYNQWNIHGRQFVHIDAKLIAWFGAAIFLSIAMWFVDTLMSASSGGIPTLSQYF